MRAPILTADVADVDFSVGCADLRRFVLVDAGHITRALITTRSLPMPDVYELLSADHREVETLLRHYDETADEAVAREIAEALTLHTEIEEQVLYPELRRIVDGGDDLANEAANEHALVKSLLARMQDSPPEDLRALMQEIGQAVAQHVASEETTIFPAMQEAGVNSGALGERLVAARGEAPSRSSGQLG